MVIKNALNQCNKYHIFRILLARTYPLFKRTGILSFLHRLNKGSLLNPYDQTRNVGKIVNRTYNLKNFNIVESFDKYLVDFSKYLEEKKKFTIGFVMNPNKYDLFNIKESCSILNTEYVIYDIRNPSLYKDLSKSECDAIVLYPNLHNNDINRNLFHEAAQILSTETGTLIYPTLRELNIYESKRSLFNFLSINNIPHPRTSIFYCYKTAVEFIQNSDHPIVFKTHIGASSSGVEILCTKKQAIKLAKRLFFSKHYLKMETDHRCGVYGYMILQEYIRDAVEYRVIKAGESWFCYQKWKTEKQTYFSGSGQKKMINPKANVLDFCYDIASEFNFTTMCFDIFETKSGQLLVNELQTWFGSYDPSEMYVNETPGRYYIENGKWVFEPGFFNVYGSMVLRLIDVISIVNATRMPAGVIRS